jgi:acyl carrier protein
MSLLWARLALTITVIMGLDTVELVVAIERFFNLAIPDPVSERLYTVGDVAEYLSQQLGIASQRQSAVRIAVAEQLLRELPTGSTEATPLHQLLPDAPALKTVRYALRERQGLLLPLLAAPPTTPVLPSLWERLTGQQLSTTPHWSTQTLSALVDWVVAYNYQKLLKPPFTSQYEVEQAVIGLTSEKSGVEVEEIRLRSSFTNDLGMN